MTGQAAIGASCWRLLAETLEPRILHSADLSPLGWGGPVAVHAGLAEATPAKTAVQATEIAFVDAGLPDAGALIADLQAQQSAGRRIEVVAIAAGSDGLALIGQTLAGRSDISAVHVLAHGSDGRLQLGSAVLDATSLLQRADELAAWSSALTADADLLLYGCDLAQGADGQRLVQGLAALTGADVAASTDLTGAAARGGNWTLEFDTGHIEAALAPSAWQQVQWQGVMATYTVTRNSDVVGAVLTPGTLRWAISQANANPGADRIVFSFNGTINMAPLTNGGDDNIDGDFDITDSLDIVGNGRGLTVIAGNGVDRVFDVRSGTVTMSGLTVRGGASNTGAGLRVDISAALSLTDVIVENNVGKGASKGGGIYNDGTLTLTRVTVQNNSNTTSGDTDGAGIYNDTDASLNARDVTISGNVANGKDGGGVFLNGGNGSVALQNATLSGNAAKNGGGVFNKHSGTTLSNVTIAGNTATSEGGGLWSNERLSLNHVTVANNSGLLGGGVFDNETGADKKVSATNSLFAANSGGNANRALTSLGYNADADGSAGLNAATDLRPTVAALALMPLANYGGYVPTIALGSGSVAIDAGDPFAPATDARGVARLGTPDIGALEAVASGQLWFTTAGAVTSAGGTSWGTGNIERFGDAGDTFEINAGVTGGTVSVLAGYNAPVPIRALNIVQSTITVGTTGAKFTLNAGDLLMVMDTGGTGTVNLGNGVLAGRQDIVVYRPTEAGNYATGTYYMLLQGGVHLGATTYNVHSLMLLETDTVVGGTVLTAGTFVVSHSNSTVHNNIYTFTAAGTGVGAATQTSDRALLIDGAKLGLAAGGDKIMGLHVLTQATAFNGKVLGAGTVLVSIDGGTNTYAGVTARAFDVVALRVTGLGANTAATGQLLFQGSDLGLSATSGANTAAKNIQGLSVSSSFYVAPNTAPVLAQPIASQTATQGSAYSYALPAGTFTAASPGSTISYAATLASGAALPAWLSFNATTQTFSGTPRNSDVGVTNVRVIATDNTGPSTNGDFALTVAYSGQAPVQAQPIANKSATQGSAFSFALPAGTFTNPNLGGTLSYSASLASGAALPTWLSFNATTQTFSGTPGGADVGALSLRVTAADDSGAATASAPFTLTTAYSGQAPVQAKSITPPTATQGVAYSFTVPAGSFTNPNLGGTLSYAAALASGAALPSWLSFDAGTQTFSGTPANADVGSLSLRVTAIDNSGAAKASDPFTLTTYNSGLAPVLAQPIANQAATQGSAFSFTLPAGTFTDPNLGGTLSYTAALTSGAALPTWLSFDAATQTFSGTPSNADVGGLSLRVTATDNSGPSTSGDFVLSTAYANQPPLANAIAPQTATQGSAFSFQVPATTFTNPNLGGTLSYAATLATGAALPSWLSFDAGTQTFSGTPANADVGMLTLRVTATDNGDASASTSGDFTLTTAYANQPPVAQAIADQSATQGSAFSFTLPAGTFTNPNLGGTLSYSATLALGAALPTWLNFDTATQTFSGTPANADVGMLTLRVTATDNGSASASNYSDFSLTTAYANQPPVAQTIANQSATQGSAFSFTLPAGTFTNPNLGGTLSYAATLSTGATLPTWLSFDASTQTFSGTPANADVGMLTLRVTATDNGNLSASTSGDFTLSTAYANQPPVAQAIADQSATQGSAFSFTLPAGTFTDPNLGGTLSYSATLASGAALPTWLSFDTATQTFTGTPANADVGMLTLRVTATDNGDASASAHGDFTLTTAYANQPPVAQTIGNQSAVQGSAFSFTLPAGTFTNPNLGGTLSYAATLGTGSTLPTWLSFDASTQTFSGTPANADVGMLTLRVTATDNGDASASTAGDFTLTTAYANQPPVAQAIVNQSATQGSAFSFTLPAGTFTDPNLGGTLSYSATLASGAALPSWLSFDASTQTFSGTPANADVGMLTLRVTATDNGDASASTSGDFTLTTAYANQPPVAQAIAPKTATQGSAFSFQVPATTFTNPNLGGTLSYSATLASGAALPIWLSFDAATQTFSGTPANADVGALSLRVIATDNGSASASNFSDFSLTTAYANQPPVAQAIAPQTATQGSAFSFQVPATTFTNPNLGGTLSYAATLASGAALPTWLSFDAATQTFTGTPANADVGMLMLRVTATDNGNLSASTSGDFTLTTAYANQPPVAQSIANQSAVQGSAFSFTLPAGTFTDPNLGGTLSYSATLASGAALPSWLSFDASTQTFSGTPANADVGVLTLRVTATDNGDASASTSGDFTLTTAYANQPPVAQSIADRSATQGSAFSFTLPAGTFTDPNLGGTLSYAATLASGAALPTWLSFDAATQTFTGTPANADVGMLMLRVTATDNGNLSASTSGDFMLSTAYANQPPVAQTIGNQSATQGSAFSFTLPAGTFTNPNLGGTLSYAATLSTGAALPSWLSFDASTLAFSGTPANADVGMLTLRVTATDNGDASASTSGDFTLTTAYANQPPVAQTIADQSATQGSPFSFTLPAGTFTNPNLGGMLCYSATLSTGAALPSWLSFDASTQSFSGTPANADVGALSLRVIATDNGDASASAHGDFTLTTAYANQPPVAQSIANQSAVQGSAFSFTLPAGTFTDPNLGGTLSYAATLSTGAALPSWLSFDASTLAFSGTPANADVGALSLRVIATDNGNASASTSGDFTLTTAYANQPPVAQAIADQSATQGSAFSFTLPAGTFTNPNLGGSLSYSATLALGAALPTWLNFDTATQTFTGTPASADVDTLTLRVTATDNGNLSASTSGDFTLSTAYANQPPVAQTIANQSATQGSAFSFTLPGGTFTDPNLGGTLSYLAMLASGAALPTWLSFDVATQTFTGTPANADVGMLTLRVTATDNGDASASTSGDFTLTTAYANQPPVAQAIAPQKATQGSAFSFQVPATTFTNPNLGGTLSYSAMLASGAALPSWLSFDASTQTFTGTPANADVGTLTLRVTATDNSGARVAASFPLTVANVNSPPTGSVTISGTPTQAQTLTARNSLQDADGLGTINYQWYANGGAISGATGSSLLLAQTQVGKAITVTASYTDGYSTAESVTSAATALVANVNDAPTGSVTITGTPTQGQTLTASNTLADADGLGATSYQWSADGVAISGATGSTLLLSQAQVGRRVSVTASYTDDFGAAESVTSAATAAVANINDVPTGSVTITGTQTQGQTLTVGNTLADADGLGTVSYQWKADGVAIGGATGGALVLGQAEIGKAISVTASYSDALGAAESLTSAATAPVAAANSAPVLAQGLADQTAVRGTTLQFALPPTAFTDADAGDTLSFVATLADGSELPQWLRFDSAQQIFVVSPPLGGDTGPVWVRVVASDAAGASAQLVFVVGLVSKPVETGVPVAVAVLALAPAPAPGVETSADGPKETTAPQPAAAAAVRDTAPASAAPVLALVQEPPEARATPAAHTLAAETPRSRLSSRADAVLAAEPVLQYGDLAGAQLLQLLKGDDMLRKLDELKRQMTDATDAHRNVMASSVVMTTGLSVGYVVWLVRGGVLVSSMLSALPAWQLIDPMPVLAAGGALARRRMPAPGDEPEVERFFGDSAQATKPVLAETAATTTLTAPAHTPPDAASVATHAAEPRP